MEEYENNSLHNCTDENELDSQPSPAEDFAAPQESTGDESQQPQGEMPESGSYDDWYDYFYRFFGGNGN